jgi:queuosine precursor transporter
MFRREHILFLILGGFLVTNAVVAEFIGIKIFSVEGTLGLQPANISLFGVKGLSFDMTAGVLLWPVVFVMTDVVNEYYGKRGVRILSWLTATLIAYSFLMVFLAMKTVPSGYFQGDVELDAGHKASRNSMFNFVFGAGLRIIIGSLTAFLLGQLLDAQVFDLMKRKMGPRLTWLRATVSTFFSQFIDSFVVLLIAFYHPTDFPLSKVLALGTVGYLYKFTVAILCIPVLYGIHAMIRAYLGRDKAEQMASLAGENKEVDTR